MLRTRTSGAATMVALLLSTTAVLANDIVIVGGRVIDPETGLDAIRNVAIEGDKIMAISEFPLAGDVVIDATGHVVSPGFIDLHSHGQNIGDYRMQVIQGVTTALELESGIVPVGDWYEEQATKKLPMNYGASAGWTHSRIATFSDTDPLATAAFFTDAQGRTDWKQDIASAEQSERIMSLLEQGLKDGALGIGINAGYAPGFGHKEYYALAELANKYNVPTYTHVRYASNTEPQSSFEAIQELISLAAITGAHMHLCHINSTSLSDIEATMALVEKAQAQGINVTTEAYPYGAASTVVGAAMFSGPNWRDRMDSTANNFQLGADRMTEDELADYQANKPGTFIVWHFLDEADPAALSLLDVSVTNPATAIASDSVLWSYFDENGNILLYDGDEWPLPDNVFSHPRSTGAYTKVLRSYVRERGILSLSEAIRKMSLLPAQTLEDSVPQMRTKGRIQVGMDADIVVFDPATVADLATFENANQPTVGVQTVIVNGGFSVRDGELVLNAPNGRAIRNVVAD
ncbi:amidohydrolase family protein [Defluviimonas sp. WL0050]|uniref:Amidohydrolase family protein n=1 Tax=Albidovulum litorale TaxID=2984134 RepID=A0ABT2ZTX2_9RHOB|nr:amidohydrolase family protein [Defluviimonas sp. WL0050]MCV2874594.1 amidohydrolase family protein [Defluviimonas sp. WL0050]